MRSQRLIQFLLLAFIHSGLCSAQAPSSTKPTPAEGDYVSRDFHFKSGEALPELRLHYTTFGKPERDASGKVTNAVLILHGTGGTGHQFLAPQFADVLFGPGQLLDARRRAPRTLPAIRLRRYGRRAARVARERPRPEPSPPGYGHLDGMHAFLGLGRNVSRLHGRAHAARLPAGRDRRTQPPLAQDGDRRHPPGSRLEKWRLQDRKSVV